jgi:hypothetical protein
MTVSWEQRGFIERAQMAVAVGRGWRNRMRSSSFPVGASRSGHGGDAGDANAEG